MVFVYFNACLRSQEEPCTLAYISCYISGGMGSCVIAGLHFEPVGCAKTFILRNLACFPTFPYLKVVFVKFLTRGPECKLIYAG